MCRTVPPHRVRSRPAR